MTITEIIVRELLFPRGEPAWVNAEVIFRFSPLDNDMDGAEIIISLGVPLYPSDTVQDVRLRLANRAQELLGAASAVSHSEIPHLLAKGLEPLPPIDFSKILP